jgi:hypothetical protein
LTACRRAVPDVDVLADYCVEAHNKLLARIEALPAPQPEAAPAPAPRAAAKKVARKATARSTRVVPAKKGTRTRAASS